MWCPQCRQDTPFRLNDGQTVCGICGAGAGMMGGFSGVRQLSSETSSGAWQSELRRVQRLVRNVDRLLEDSRVPARTEKQTIPFPTRIEAGRTPSDSDTFVDPTRTLTWSELCGMLVGLAVMLGSLIVTGMVVAGKCSPQWIIAPGLAVCVTTGLLLMFWQRIEQQDRDLQLLQRHLSQQHNEDGQQLLRGMVARLDAGSSRVGT